jgi:hypothetical protein
MFGTLYVTTSKPEPLQFGTPDHERYLTIYSLIVTPFVTTARKLMLTRGTPTHGTKKQPAAW